MRSSVVRFEERSGFYRNVRIQQYFWSTGEGRETNPPWWLRFKDQPPTFNASAFSGFPDNYQFHFFDSVDGVPGPFRPEVPFGCFYSYRTDSLKYGVVRSPVYIELKDSINSPSQVADEDLRRVDIWKIDPKFALRRPKKPVFVPRPFMRSPPIYPDLLDIKALHPIKEPRDAKTRLKWLKTTKPLILEKRRLYVESVNRRRLAKYRKNFDKYTSAKERAQKKEEVRYEAHKNRVAKYESYLLSWEAAKKNRQKKFWRILRPHYSQENPYRFCSLTNVGDQGSLAVMTAFWDSARGGSVADGVVNPPPHLVNYNGEPFPYDFEETEVLQLATAEAAYTAIQRSSVDLFTELEDLQIRKLYGKLGNKSVHLGNLLAERAQTMTMLVTLCHTIADVLLSNKKNMIAWAKHLSHPKQVANQILAFKFGLEPLVKDLHDLISILNSDTDSLACLSVRCNTRRLTSFDSPEVSFSGVAECSYVIKSYMDADIPRLLDRMGLTNPVETLWEVTPWSFVADWFLPIGDWISSWSATRHLTFRSGTVKHRLTGSFDFRGTGASYDSYSTNFGEMTVAGFSGGKFSGTWKNRKVLSEYPDANRILRFKNPFSQWHSIEAVSLIVQRLRVT